MRRLFVVLGLLLSGFVMSCVTEEEFRALRADMAALERERSQRDSNISRRLEALDSRITQPQQGQRDLRRELVQAITTTEKLRLEIRDLRGSVQELQHRLKQGAAHTAAMRDRMATKLAEMETHLAALEYRLDPTASPPFTPPETQQTTVPSTPSSPPATATPPPTTRPLVTTRPVPVRPTPPPNEAADSLYKKALRKHQGGDYEVAIVLFKQFLRQYPQNLLTGHAQYWIGASLYTLKQYEAAIVAFDEVVQKYPQDTKVPAAILKQGFAFAALKEKPNARFFLQQVQQKYPDTPEARQATEKLKQLKR